MHPKPGKIDFKHSYIYILGLEGEILLGEGKYLCLQGQKGYYISYVQD